MWRGKSRSLTAWLRLSWLEEAGNASQRKRAVITPFAVQLGVFALTEVARRYHHDVAALSEAGRRLQLRVSCSRMFIARDKRVAEGINTVT